MKKCQPFFLLILITFLFQGNALSRDIVWTGNGATPIWGDPNNWDCNCIPGTDGQEADDVTIGDGMTPEYVDFGYFNVSINSLLLRNAELDLQLYLEVMDYTDVNYQSTITFAYYSTENYSILSTSTLFFFGTINVSYNNVPGIGSYLDLFNYDEIFTDCEGIFTEFGSGDGFTVEQMMLCEDFGDGVQFGPLEIYSVEYDNTTASWIGNSDDNLWHNPENWNPEIVPGINDIAVLSEGAEVVALLPINVKNLLLGVDCTLEINDGLESELYTWVDEYALITWKGGDLSKSNVNQQNIIFNYGEIIIETSSVKNITNGLSLSNNGQYAQITIKEDVVIGTDGNSNTLRNNQSGTISFEGDNQNIYFDEIINVGTIEKTSGLGNSKIKSSSGTFINYNNLRCNSGILTLGDNFDNRGRISGNGSFDFDFESGTPEILSGGITPGNSPGALTIVRDIELVSSTNLVMEIQGTSGTHYDQLLVEGDITINGILNVQKPSWYVPQQGDQHKIITSTGNISGAFSHIAYPDLSGDWSIAYSDKDIVVSFGALLPVELIDISVKSEEAGNLLEWTTLSEVNSQDFIMQVSNKTSSWQELGKLTSKGSAISGFNYHFLHRLNDSNVYYYRLKMRDLDGTYEYSKIVSTRRRIKNEAYSVFPNPATDILHIKANRKQTWKGATAVVLNSTGQEIKQFVFNKESKKIDLKEFKTGFYFLLIREKNGILTTYPFTKT